MNVSSEGVQKNAPEKKAPWKNLSEKFVARKITPWKYAPQYLAVRCTSSKVHSKNSNFQLSGYQVIHQTKKNRKGGRFCVFVHENLSFKLRKDLSINCDAIQSLS